MIFSARVPRSAQRYIKRKLRAVSSASVHQVHVTAPWARTFFVNAHHF